MAILSANVSGNVVNKPAIRVELIADSIERDLTSLGGSNIIAPPPPAGPIIPDPYVLANATAVGVKSFSIGTVEGTPEGIILKPDGTRIFNIGNNNQTVRSWVLSTPFDVTTALLEGPLLDASAHIFQGYGLDIDPTGMHLYINDATIHHYIMSTPWDLSTATHTNDITTPGANVHGCAISNDGTKIFWTNATDRHVHMHDMSTPFDLSTAIYNASNVLDVLSEDTGPQGLHLHPNGKQLWITGAQNLSLYEYDMSTAYDLTTASFISSFSVGAQESGVRGVTWSQNGDFVYIVGIATDTFYQYPVIAP